jgi:hypothetical protein
MRVWGRCPQRVQGRALASLAVLALAGCGAYPEPFNGRPGRMGARLAVPPPPLLVVGAPTQALMASADAARFAADLASALAARQVPAVAVAGPGPNWRLTVRAEMHEAGAQGAMVVPTYTVRNPRGVDQGSVSGPAVSAQTWSMASPVALQLVAARDAPAVAQLLDSINARVQLSDPNSLLNRPPVLAFTGVSGAPGDGNTELSNDMGKALAGLGIVVQPGVPGSDYQLAGRVIVSPAEAGQQRVEIAWSVLDVYGHDAGHLVQLNDIPAGTLDHYWGDVALVATQAAAGGIRQVIANQMEGKRIHGESAAAAAGS